VDPIYKLEISIGNSKFAAEGPEEAVKAAFEAWRALVTATPAALESGQKPKAETVPATDTNQMAALLDRVFSKDEPAGVSLLVKPRTDRVEADSLILLLYGFLKIRNQTAVTAVRLGQAAEKSGLQLDRIDRVTVARKELITEAGQRRGKKYGLNNPGVAHAEKMLGEILK
jgi:hypothetical protein